jgi:hypothetical protein
MKWMMMLGCGVAAESEEQRARRQRRRRMEIGWKGNESAQVW